MLVGVVEGDRTRGHWDFLNDDDATRSPIRLRITEGTSKGDVLKAGHPEWLSMGQFFEAALPGFGFCCATDYSHVGRHVMAARCAIVKLQNKIAAKSST